MRRLEAIRSCMLPEDLLPEHGREAEATAERVREWLCDWRREQAELPTDNGG